MENIGERLREAEMRRQVAIREQRAATDAFRELLREAGEVMSIRQAAKQAGISPQSAYRILARR